MAEKAWLRQDEVKPLLLPIITLPPLAQRGCPPIAACRQSDFKSEPKHALIAYLLLAL